MGLAATIGVRLLEGMFALGTVGSVLVLILTGIEDIETLLGKDSEHN
jgi:hypothetical protein